MRLKKIFLVIAAVVVCGFVLYILSALAYPDVSRLAKETPQKSAFMEYREKQWAAKGRKIRIRKIWAPLSTVSPYLIKAVLIAEDDKFWAHEGFDFEAMQKAVEKDLKEKKLKFGASTISQQLAKNLYLSPSKNPARKLREAILTWRIENKLTKKRILELYLNMAEWGDGLFGIEAAARHYYAKPASALSPEESARLASVLPNPLKYNPLSASGYVQNRSQIIYNIMLKRGIVIPEYSEIMTGNGGPDKDNSSVPDAGQNNDGKDSGKDKD
ncbi:MAG: monofunctional biosynthetic peptidoglycan transglycosylase [Nitrospirae bacterium]|nr:MAG: monofunctional biosynthetic peptidoglycan transglycosylase [Nitrospirota bacterium]